MPPLSFLQRVSSIRPRNRRQLGLEALEHRALLDAATLGAESAVSAVVYDLVHRTQQRIPLTLQSSSAVNPPAPIGGGGGAELTTANNAASTLAASPSPPPPAGIIYSPDTRQLVTSTSFFPTSAIGRLSISWPDGTGGGCSGALVSAYHILTAGHCIFQSAKGGEATAVSFSPGQLGNTIGSSRSDFQPWGRANVTIIRTFNHWVDDEDYDYDIAMLTLDRRVGNFTGAFPWAFNSDDDWYDGRSAYTAGYPGDLNDDPMTSLKPDRMDMYSASGTISDVTGDTLESVTLDSFKGQSGSPIYFFSGQERKIHAVLSGSYDDPFTDYNRFTRITSEKSDFFNDWFAWDEANAKPLDRADLVDDNSWFQSQFGFVAPQSVQAGDIMLIDTKVLNVGTAPSGSFDVEFRLSNNNDTFDTNDLLLGTFTVGSIAPFDTALVDFAAYVPTAASPGNYSVVWMIDPDDDVNEFNEQNNAGDGTSLLDILSAPSQLLDRSISVTPGVYDDHGNTSGAATSVAVPSTTYGQIQYQNDVDYFEFTAVGGATYNFEIEPVKDAITDLLPLADSTLTLYGTNGTTQLDFNNNAYAGVKWSRIVWTAPADGAYFVKVGTNAGLGRYLLKATIKDDHGNSSFQATEVEVPSETPGTIEIAGDPDWFEFETHVGGVYTIETSLGTLDDSRLTVYDPFGDQLAYNDDNCGGVVCSKASRIVFTAQWADTYFAKVTGGPGDVGTYTLHALVDDDWGDSKAEAKQLLQKVGWDGQPLPLGEKGEIEDPGDVDWFEFVAGGGVTYTIETILKTLPDSTLTLFAANGTTQLAFNDDFNGPASRIVWTAPALGVYYVQVAAPGSETGTYDLKITADDDHPAASASTDVLESGPFVDGNIVLPEDSDWFKIWATAGANYLLETSELTLRDGTLAVYDGDGRTQLAFNDDAPGAAPGSMIDWTAPSDGYYYIVVGSKRGSAPGSYMIRSRVDDVGNTADTARRVSNPYYGDGKLETAGDSDWYSFGAVGGQTYLIRTYLGDLADSTLTLYDIDPSVDGSRELAFNDNISRTELASLIEWTAPHNGRFYVRVGSAQDRLDGSYTLVIGNPDEHSDDTAGATRAGADSTTPGEIGLLGDADWFSFAAMAGQTYTLGVGLETLPAATLMLYDRDGRTPLDSAEANVEVTSDIRWTAPADGIYFAKVAGGQNRVLGAYSLDISTGVPNTPPAVSGVLLSSTAWTQPFREHLTFGLPDHFGYPVPSGSEVQFDPLPWTNLDQIQLRLIERVLVQLGSLSLVDARGADYSSQIAGFTYDPVTSDATWTFARPLPANTYLATLTDSVRDPLGLALDGEWVDAASSYPSGDGMPGGAFRFRFQIAPGDVDRSGQVDRADLLVNLDAQFSAIGSPNYTVFGDLDGDGVINILDWSRIRDQLPRIGASAPSAAVATVPRPRRTPTVPAAAVDRILGVEVIVRRPANSPAEGANTTQNRITASRLRATRQCPDGFTDPYFSEIALPREFSSISSLSSRASQPMACITRSRG